jgi:hypothetical protein
VSSSGREKVKDQLREKLYNMEMKRGERKTTTTTTKKTNPGGSLIKRTPSPPRSVKLKSWESFFGRE